MLVHDPHSLPRRGTADQRPVGRNIDFGGYVLSSALPFIRNGKRVALGTNELKRSRVTREIPALSETAQLKGIDIGTWYVLMGPANLPASATARRKKALADSLQSPELQKKREDASSTIAPPAVEMEKFLIG